MIEFMVLGAPRSGTAWAANFLTTDNTLCLHDPMWRYHYDELDKIDSRRILGVSCTGLALIPKYLRSHAARKVVLHRPIEEIEASLADLRQGQLAPHWEETLASISGLHVSWTDLFNPLGAKRIYEWLLDREFDADRHRELVNLNVQMNFATVSINRDATARLFRELRQIQEALA